MIVRRVCCFCRTTLGLLVSDTMTGATHGACAPCAQAWLAAWRASRRAA